MLRTVSLSVAPQQRAVAGARGQGESASRQPKQVYGRLGIVALRGRGRVGWSPPPPFPVLTGQVSSLPSY
jgi:hypothetical protein